jgi:hypothetical protein
MYGSMFSVQEVTVRITEYNLQLIWKIWELTDVQKQTSFRSTMFGGGGRGGGRRRTATEVMVSFRCCFRFLSASELFLV